MKLSYRAFPGTTNPFSGANAKQQLYWVLIVAAGLLIAVRAGSFFGSWFGAAPAPVAVVAVSEAPAAPATGAAGVEAAAAVVTIEQPTPVPSAEVPAQLSDSAQADATTAAHDTGASASTVAQPIAPNDASDVAGLVQAVVVSEQVETVKIEQATESSDDDSESAGDTSTIETSDERAAVVAHVLAAFGARQTTLEDDTIADNVEVTPAGATWDSDSDAGDRASEQLATEVLPATAETDQANDVLVADKNAALRSLFGAGKGAAQDASSDTNSSADVPLDPPHEEAEAVVESLTLTSEVAESSVAANQLGDDAASLSTEETGAPSEENSPTEMPRDDAAPDGQAAEGSNADVVAGAKPELSQETEVVEELVLINPAESGGVIRYLVNGHTFAMAPGHTQRLPAGREWRVEFHRGESFGDARHVLRSGRFEFRPTPEGWQLSTGQESVAGPRADN